MSEYTPNESAELYTGSTSAFGICPTGLSVHAHAAAGDVGTILFTTTNQGNSQITDSLHQNLMGTAIAF